MPAATAAAATTSAWCGSSGAARASRTGSPASISAGCSRSVSTAASPTPKRHSIRRVESIRALEPLWPLRQRRNAVIACLDDARELESARAALDELRAELVVEREPGPLSAALGRPSVTVASRYGRIGWRGEAIVLDRVLEALETFELACPECGPQAWGDPGL